MASKRLCYVLEQKLGKHWTTLAARVTLEAIKDRAAEETGKWRVPEWDSYRIVVYLPGKPEKILPAFGSARGMRR